MDITRDNAFDYYKKCYDHLTLKEILFILKEYSKEQILCWNEKIILDSIKEYKSNIDKIKSNIDVYKEIGYLYEILSVYVRDKEIYHEKIELLKELYKNYGYFMNYFMNYFMVGNDDMIHMMGLFAYYWNFKIDREDYNKPTNPGFYNKRRTRCGLIPDLLDLKYYDLLDEYLEECFLPICLHYNEKSKFMDNNLWYYPFDNMDISKAHNITNAIKLLRENNYILPKKLDICLKNKGL